jgi:hypothetical protein
LFFCWRRLGVPFIDSRGLGAVGIPFGKQSLFSVGWRTGQSGAPPDMNNACPVPDLLPFLAKTTVAPSDRLAHRTVRCTPDSPVRPLTVGSGHALPADYAADRWLGRLRLTGQFGAPPDSPVNFIHDSPIDSREMAIHRRVSLGHRTLSGAPPDSPVCQASAGFGYTKPYLLQLFSSWHCF